MKRFWLRITVFPMKNKSQNPREVDSILLKLVSKLIRHLINAYHMRRDKTSAIFVYAIYPVKSKTAPAMVLPMKTA